jgi:penicillin-binding protein 1A
MSLATALAQSVNTVAAQVAQRAGIAQVIATANRLGIASELGRDASLALGSNEVNLLELVSAYAPFANGGIGMLAYGITDIWDGDGHILYHRDGTGPGRVIAPELAGAMNRMLAGVMTHGTGRNAALGRPAAGKTGTTQEYRDAWFVGYTADLVAGVWLGNDDNSPMHKVTGGTLPAAVWRNFMLAATRDMPVRKLPSGPPSYDRGPSDAGEASALDRLFGWLTGAETPPAREVSGPAPSGGDRYPGPAPHN